MDQKPIMSTSSASMPPAPPKPPVAPDKKFYIPPYIYTVIIVLVIAVGILALLPEDSIAPDTTSDSTENTSAGIPIAMENPFVITEPEGTTVSALPSEIKLYSKDRLVTGIWLQMDSGMGASASVVDGAWVIPTSTIAESFKIGANHFVLVPQYADEVAGTPPPQDFTLTIVGPMADANEATLSVKWLAQPVKVDIYGFLLGDETKVTSLQDLGRGVYGEVRPLDQLGAWAYKVGAVQSGPYDKNGVFVFSSDICIGEMGCTTTFYRFLKDPVDGKLRLLTNYSEPLRANEAFLVDEMLDGVIIPGLDVPEEFSLEGLNFHPTSPSWISGPENWFFEQELVPISWHPNYGTIYTTPQTAERVTDMFYIKLPDGRAVSYTYDIPFFKDGQTPQITWNDGTKNTASYTWKMRTGCGDSEVDRVISEEELRPSERLVRAGVTSNGEAVYVLKDSNSNDLGDMYDAYTPYRSENETVLSYDEFVAQRPSLYWQDPFGRWLRFARLDFMPAVECGKPVIYLYPEKEIAVHVTVGLHGKMTVSEPPHGKYGWDVKARPDGYVVADGKTYPNLFWEGTGVSYEIPKQGFVMETKNADAWFARTLREIGFTERENAEFREFWVPRMPKTPYVFVTFVPQKDFDRDAPLLITPKPDRVFRVFMESRGLYEPIAVDPLPLPKIVRDGFTVVEWGGALR